MLTDSIELNQKYNEHTAVALIGRGRSTFERSDLMLSSTGQLILIDHPVLRMSDPRALSERQHHYPDAHDVSLASPEAIQGRSTTPAAFVYTLACLTVHLCTGDGPFRGRDEIATALKHISSEPDLRIKNDRLRQLMLFCLEKNPVYRRSSIREFRQELETVFD